MGSYLTVASFVVIVLALRGQLEAYGVPQLTALAVNNPPPADCGVSRRPGAAWSGNPVVIV
ncbi:hypothetical protein GCM10022251_77580 [Phytohabitans flavus]|uniref:Uncharacterized protein n=1 Tax=Phytohabitans flavus TaxID=1076124 RepID=A0A6F8XIL3_9ACTN|nr:hypothetical protein [Phytohabitans flavus]BCB73650.1 hypothetical protein Pflav_000600 [Phytohabitans flavus]